MTFNDQMRIIINWTYKFQVRCKPDGRWYGEVWLSHKPIRTIVGPHGSPKQVLDKCYDFVGETVWGIVVNNG